MAAEKRFAETVEGFGAMPTGHSPAAFTCVSPKGAWKYTSFGSNSHTLGTLAAFFWWPEIHTAKHVETDYLNRVTAFGIFQWADFVTSLIQLPLRMKIIGKAAYFDLSAPDPF